MKFPGRRKFKHYFPVNADNRFNRENTIFGHIHTTVCGIDQNLVDVCAKVDDSLLQDFGLKKGESQLIDNDTADALYRFLKEHRLIENQYAGGTIGNTLHNYSVLADDRSVQFGVMSQNICVGDASYRYLCNTSSRVDLTYLQPVNGAIGRCFALITQEGERTFGISPGKMNELHPDFICEKVIAASSALALCAYTLSNDKLPIYHATLKAAKLARKHNIPVILTLGTKGLVEAIRDRLQQFIQDYITVVAMNEEEAEALTGIADPLKASDSMLSFTDMVLLTAGAEGLFLSGYTETSMARETDNPLYSSSITDFNRYEFSRPMRKRDCQNPMKVYSYIAPYMGGPDKIYNTNGAGDGALSALIHDISANDFHRQTLPSSSKHKQHWLTYSSFSQICKYANRVSYEVLAQNSPRLSWALPEKEDSLEEAYWER